MNVHRVLGKILLDIHSGNSLRYLYIYHFDMDHQSSNIHQYLKNIKKEKRL